MVRIRSTYLVIAILVVLLGCAQVAQLVLDDSWALDEIRAGDVITTNLDDYIVVDFNAANDAAEITVGPAWSDLSDVNVSGTFDLGIDNRNLSIILSRDDEVRYTISFSLTDGGDRMVWNEWNAVRPDSNIEIVGDDSVIESIAFERQE